MSEDGLSKTAKRIEAVRKIITNVIWIAIVIVVLSTIGRYLMVQDTGKTSEIHTQERTIAESIPWHEVDQAVATAITETRLSAKAQIN